MLTQLSERVREAGGMLLDEACRPRRLAFARHPTADVYSCGCGGTTRFQIPYEDERGQTRAATLCGVCDAPYMTPRFEPI